MHKDDLYLLLVASLLALLVMLECHGTKLREDAARLHAAVDASTYYVPEVVTTR